MSEIIEVNLDRLEGVDSTLRTNAVGVYLACLGVSQRLDHVSVHPISVEEAKENRISPIGETLHSSSGKSIVTFGTEPSEYVLYVSGVLRARFPGCRRFIDAQETEHEKLLRLIEVVLAHELRHAHEFQVDCEQKGPERAFTEYFATYNHGLRSLPLAASTTQAMEWWDNNTGGYRTYLIRAGYSDEIFNLRIRENAEAYGEIPHEKRADVFAEKIMMTMYPELDFSPDELQAGPDVGDGANFDVHNA